MEELEAAVLLAESERDSITTNIKELSEKRRAFVKAEKSKIININRIHFAMNGNWLNGGTHVYPIDDETKTINWLKGVLSHLRVQLLYVTK